MVVSKFCNKRRLIGRSNGTPFIEEVEDTQGVVVDELNDFEVVGKLYFAILVNQAFLLEDLFLLFEDFVEVNLVESFIGIVDEKLFETVGFQHFKSVNVQKSQTHGLLWLLFGLTFFRR